MPLDIVFDIGGMRARCGLADDLGQIHSPVTLDSPATPEAVVAYIQEMVDSFAGIAADPVVGIALGGMVEKNGLVTSGSLNMVEYPLAERLDLKWPFVILNDAKASALAEATYNAGLAPRASFLLMTLSAGIGGGVIINGDLYEGQGGTAGEVGHMIIDRGLDFYCRLGHRGCLDALASGRALQNRLQSLWREGHWTHLSDAEVTLAQMPTLLAAGDGMALRLMREAGHWIGLGVMHVIRILDPQEIIFKGYMATALWPYLEPNIRYVLESFERPLPLSLCSLGDNVGLIGAGLAAKRLRPPRG
jgi:glucokinase